MKTKNNKKQMLLLGTSLLATQFMTVTAEAAQDQNGTALEEIIVTSTKRETALSDTAIAITAFTRGKRDRLGIEGLQDFADMTPGLTAQDAPNRLSIRGVGRLTNALGSDPGVGIYKDGIFTSETATIGSTTLTTERVEVLRGPQGTLYGRNTIGGAVNVISIRPTEDWQAHARVRLGNYDQFYAGAWVSGPLTDDIRIRLAGAHNERDGYIENIGDGEDQWADDSYYAEAQIEWDLSENLDIWVKYEYSEYDTTPRDVVTTTPYRTDVFRGDLVINPVFGFGETNPAVNDPYTVSLNHSGYQKLEDSHSVTGHLTWEFDSFTFKYMGGWSTYDYSSSVDADFSNRTDDIVFLDAGTGVPLSVPASLENPLGESKEWSTHDFQLISNGDGVEWLVGAYFFKEDVSQPFALRQPGNTALGDPRLFTPEAPGPTNAFLGFSWQPSLPNPDFNYYRQLGLLNSTAFAFYGQTSFDLTDKLTMTAGLRYSNDKKTGSEEQRVIFDQLNYSIDPQVLAALLGGFLPPTTFPFGLYSVDVTGGILSDTHEASWDAITGVIAAEYRPNDDDLWYLSASRGFKSGGFRLGGISDDPATPGVDEAEVGDETLLAFEVGYKGTFNDVFQLNAAAFFYDYDGLQAEVNVRRNGINLIELFNAERSEVYGLELEGIWQAGPNTQFNASYSYNHSTYKDFCGDRATTNPDGSSGCLVDPLAAAGDTNLVDPSGNTLNKAPKHKFAVIGNHSIPFDAGSLSLTATYAYVSGQQYSVFNYDETRVDGYSRFDARVSWYDDDNSFQIHAYLRNAFNTAAATSSTISGAPYFQVNRSFNAPRTFGIELQTNF